MITISDNGEVSVAVDGDRVSVEMSPLVAKATAEVIRDGASDRDRGFAAMVADLCQAAHVIEDSS